MITHLSDIIIYTLFGFAVLFPFFLWFTPRKIIDSGFYNFNLGLSGLLGGMAIVLFISGKSYLPILFGMIGWLGLHLAITFFYWNSGKVSNIVVSISSVVGGIIFSYLMIHLLPIDKPVIVILMAMISQAIVASVLFAMILGHWYLNVIQLPIRLLQKASNGLAGLLSIRLIWNLFQFPSVRILNDYGVSQTLLQYLQTLDGFFLGVAFFFGIIVPFSLHFLIWRTLKLHATQSATGLLYISVLSIMVGDLCYKFILFQDGLIL